MGSSLRRDLREALPASVKGLPRAVALEIADDARWDDAWRYNPEAGRRSKASLSDLTRWTAAKNERVISDALRVLALAGWEFRVPFGKGKDGRLLYAVPGRAVEFRVPDFEAPTTVGPIETEGPVTTGPSQQGPVTTAKGPVVTAEGPVTTASEPVGTGPPSPIPSYSPKESPSSVAELSTDLPAVVAKEGGGGGSLDESRSTAEEIASALDYRGKTPDKRQRKTIADRLAAALASGWTVDGLALYLDLGTAAVDSPAAVYAHRLKPGVLPDAEPLPAPAAARGGVRGRMPTAEEYANLTIEDVLGTGRPDPAPVGMWEQATARARARMGGGTDSTVAGWAAVAADLGRREPHRPYTNDAWTAPANPAEAAKIPHCGHLDCDEISRMRDHDIGNGLKAAAPCEKCHPAMQW